MSRKTHADDEDRKNLAEVLAHAAIEPEVMDETGAVDGRHARSERSRQAMVDALLDLMREGTLRPSSAQIAERAGVTQRTLFNQFGDMDSLVTAVAARQVQRFLELQPKAGAGTTEQRVSSYCDGLQLLLDETMHVRWAVVTSPNPTWTGAGVVRGALDFTRKQLREAFAAELEQLEVATREEVLDALELETDPVVWRMRRLQQELSSAEARNVVERTMLAILRDAVIQASNPATG
jgi:TetR/AcrR family transcriptional regulator of autoinduction and epiphytic fitness